MGVLTFKERRLVSSSTQEERKYYNYDYSYQDGVDGMLEGLKELDLKGQYFIYNNKEGFLQYGYLESNKNNPTSKAAGFTYFTYKFIYPTGDNQFIMVEYSGAKDRYTKESFVSILRTLRYSDGEQLSLQEIGTSSPVFVGDVITDADGSYLERKIMKRQESDILWKKRRDEELKNH